MDKNKLQKIIFRRNLKTVLFLLLSYVLAACSRGHVPQKVSQETALTKIKQSGAITLITQYNSYCYYKYRGKPMGFEYDLAKAFAQFLGVKLKVQVARNWDEMVSSMEQGHFLAAKLNPSLSRLKVVDFSDGYLTIQRHIIYHKNNRDIRAIEDLEGQTIHIRKGSLSEESLNNLIQTGIRFTINTWEDATIEDLLQAVTQKKIGITIADCAIALHSRRYYPDIKIGFSIEEKQSLAWAVPKGEKDLLEEINRFFKTIWEDGTFRKIYTKYYSDAEVFDYQDIKKYHKRLETRLPRYEYIIKKMARKYGFDWRMIAALMYQESHFNPETLDPSDVQGLMQLTLVTAREMGIDNRLDPSQNIMAGVKYLRYLYNLYNKSPEQDRLLISLASYNVGRRHILDAQELARRMNLNPNLWSSIKKTLPLLSRSKYYRQSRYGYCRGSLAVRYVQRIMVYYDILRRKAVDMARNNEMRPDQQQYLIGSASSPGLSTPSEG
ncbi:MAG: membrane-bound lytic murein transglycosylase MltF [bacterium]